jgi:hypothetical protein
VGSQFDSLCDCLAQGWGDAFQSNQVKLKAQIEVVKGAPGFPEQIGRNAGGGKVNIGTDVIPGAVCE